MDASTIGLVAFGLVIVLLALRVPIAFVLAGVATVGTFLIYAFRSGSFVPERAINPTSSMVVNSFFELIHSYDLSMIPLFVALGKLATASVAAGGTLGSLIPPSVLFILYGIFTETSISKLFLAGILPGLLTLAGYVLVVIWWTTRDPSAAPVDPNPLPKGARLKAAISAWPAAMLFAVIIGGIYGGLFTATEAAAISVVLTILIGFFERTLTLRSMWTAIRESLVQTSAIFLIAACAKIFVSFVALTGAAGMVSQWVADAGLSPLMLMAAICVLYLFLGMFLDPVGIIVLTLPFVIPMVDNLGMDLIWFGVIVVKLLEIGLITPPVGLNVFVIGNVTDRSIKVDTIFAGVSRFLAMDIVVLAILVLVPAISTMIPNGL